MTWNGSNQKKWDWYKYTKPCNNIINNGTCANIDCNYAHNVTDYMNAVLKRKFNLDPIIIKKLTLATITTNTMCVEEAQVSKKRTLDDMEYAQDVEAKKRRMYAST